MRAYSKTPRVYYFITEADTGAFLCSGSSGFCAGALGLSTRSIDSYYCSARRGSGERAVVVRRFPAVKYEVRDPGGELAATVPTMIDAAAVVGAPLGTVQNAINRSGAMRSGWRVDRVVYEGRKAPDCRERYREACRRAMRRAQAARRARR